MTEQINKWVKVEKIKDLVVVNFNLDFHPLTPRKRWTENMVRELLLENDYNPGKCLQTSKVLNNRAVGENSPFLKELLNLSIKIMCHLSSLLRQNLRLALRSK